MVQEYPEVHSSLYHGPHSLCQEMDTFFSFPCVPYYKHKLSCMVTLIVTIYTS